MATGMVVQGSAPSYIAIHGGSALSKELARQKLFLLVIPLSKALKAQSVRVKALRSSDSEEKPMVNEQRRVLLRELFGAVGVGISALAARSARAEDERFLEKLEMGRLKNVHFYENGTFAVVETVSPELGYEVQRVRVQVPGTKKELLQKFRAKTMDSGAHNPQDSSGSVLLNLLNNLAFPLLSVSGLFFLSRKAQGVGQGGPGNPLFVEKSKPKFQMEPSTGVTFDDVAGVDEAKEDFMEVVEFLKRPDRLTAMACRIPKGLLLVGPPGTGKTLLARAIAGEAGVPFYSISGSEFVVRVGPSRVKELFEKAKENAPCIVFVDEIDGRQRETVTRGVNDEREQALNQLLTEVDGFEGNTGIIVVAATNRADILDVALLSPGRFDRWVTVDVPDVNGRTEILKGHAGIKKNDTDTQEIVPLTIPGFPGSDPAHLPHEAAIQTGRRGKTTISTNEINDSIDRIVASMEGGITTDGKSKSPVAYQEDGHAVCGTLTPGHDPVRKVALIPGGEDRDLTWFVPGGDPSLLSKNHTFDDIVGVSGRRAEETMFGEREATSGAAGDLMQVTLVATQEAKLFGPGIFKASKLQVLLLGKHDDERPLQHPRIYTLTHSDLTAMITLAVAREVNKAQVKGWYSKLQRDEVVAEWRRTQGEMSLHVHCHISGTNFLHRLIAKLRFYIFQKELPLVLDSFMQGDRFLFKKHPELLNSPVWVYFHSNVEDYNRVECWGPLVHAIKNGVQIQQWGGPENGSKVVRETEQLLPGAAVCLVPCECCSRHETVIPIPESLNRILQQTQLRRQNKRKGALQSSFRYLSGPT